MNIEYPVSLWSILLSWVKWVAKTLKWYKLILCPLTSRLYREETVSMNTTIYIIFWCYEIIHVFLLFSLRLSAFICIVFYGSFFSSAVFCYWFSLIGFHPFHFNFSQANGTETLNLKPLSPSFSLSLSPSFFIGRPLSCAELQVFRIAFLILTPIRYSKMSLSS